MFSHQRILTHSILTTPAAGREGSAGAGGLVPQFDRSHVLGGKPAGRGRESAAGDAVEGYQAPQPQMGAVGDRGGGRKGGGRGGLGGGMTAKAEPGSQRKRQRRDYDGDETYTPAK
eukprot:scaffold98664_cov20-Tisochrysis_lutea.AAC.2